MEGKQKRLVFSENVRLQKRKLTFVFPLMFVCFDQPYKNQQQKKKQNVLANSKS
jgi:hypothetical protein